MNHPHPNPILAAPDALGTRPCPVPRCLKRTESHETMCRRCWDLVPEDVQSEYHKACGIYIRGHRAAPVTEIFIAADQKCIDCADRALNGDQVSLDL